jgi:flagellar basal-body rod protein FlgB
MISGDTSTRLEHYLDLLATRQKVVASNIANANTPGYRTRDIDFQQEYLSLVQDGSPRVVEVGDLKGRNDGNNVSLDREARLLAENAIRFSAASNLLRSGSASCAAQSKERDEPVFLAIGKRFRHGGAAKPGGAAGREPGQCRNHTDARQPVPAQRRVRFSAADFPFSSIFQHR